MWMGFTQRWATSRRPDTDMPSDPGGCSNLSPFRSVFILHTSSDVWVLTRISRWLRRLACMNGPVYIWNHQKEPSAMTPDVVTTALQGHLHVGVFPTVRIPSTSVFKFTRAQVCRIERSLCIIFEFGPVTENHKMRMRLTSDANSPWPGPCEEQRPRNRRRLRSELFVR